MAGKRPQDLAAGDRVRAFEPEGEAVIVRSYISEATMTGPRGAMPNKRETDRLAWIVVFEMVTGARRGRTFAVFLHPDDLVRVE